MTRLNDLRELDRRTSGEDKDDLVRRQEEILDALLNRPAPLSSVTFIPAGSRVTLLGNDAAQPYGAILLTSGQAGQPVQSTRFTVPLLIEAASTALPIVATEQ
jgi:hypothetical protein